ncbi:amidohydrolase family protein [Bordetella petrii]|uniref:amidohydrolase family protein n=1 Tax=Bordetella petrii TaxID=94624 RepID=UPI001E45C7E1|nr:amidohydrolase family protein [Bordetella petrii]MCD0502303.1 amidohydrolase family protein [Bordetella petrii]
MSAPKIANSDVYLPFNNQLKSAKGRLPAGSCDCHFHVFDEIEKYPFSPQRAYTPTRATQADYDALREAYGIDRAVLVHPSVYGPDHRSFEALLEKNNGWLRGVAVVHADTPDEDIARWHQLGTRGTRINVLFENGPTMPQIENIIDKVRPYGWHIQLFGDLVHVPELAPYIVKRGLDVVVDHLAHGEPAQLIQSQGFKNLLELMREGTGWVKLSAPYRLSTNAPRYPEVTALVNAFLDANPRQAVWGTDWPHPHIRPPMPNDGDLVDLLFDWLPDEQSRNAVLVENPTRLYWSD